MQISSFAPSRDLTRHETEEQAAEAAPLKIRMSAEAAKLGKPRLAHALACHGNEAPIDFHTPEGAEALRAEREGARLGECGKRQHIGGIGFRQRLDPAIRDTIGRALRHHLHEPGIGKGHQPLGNDDWFGFDDRHDFISRRQLCQGFETFDRIVRRRRKGHDGRRIAA
ncbi:conserved hypothetical protein, partial [Ricinus communis]